MTVELKNVVKVDDAAGFTYYLGTLTPKHIKELTYVPVVQKSATAGMTGSLNEREEHGYQRAGDAKRMLTIRNFVKENPACIIPPVLLSARGLWKFHASSGSKSFGTLEAEELAAIVDGQHRLGGLWLLATDAEADATLKDRPIPFMLIADMNVEKEQENFININDTQQGVKKSLLKYLQKDDRFIGQAAYALKEDEESVFCGRIEIQEKKDSALILFGAAVDCVALTFGKDFASTTQFLPDSSNENKTKAINFLLQYWKLISVCMPAFWADMEKMPAVGNPKSKDNPGTRAFDYRLLEETGIRAISKLGSDIFIKTWVSGTGTPAWDQVESLLKKLAEVDTVRKALTKVSRDPSVKEWDPDLKSFGKAGVDAIYRHLRAALLQIQ